MLNIKLQGYRSTIFFAPVLEIVFMSQSMCEGNLTEAPRWFNFLSSGGQEIMSAAKDAVDQNFDYMFKLLIIGNSSVGKTSFLVRYAEDSFTSAFVSTVGIDFKVKTVFRQDKRVKLQIWVR